MQPINPKKLSTLKHIILLIRFSKSKKFNWVRFALKSSLFFFILSVICFSYLFKSLSIPSLFDESSYLAHLNFIKAVGGFSLFSSFWLLVWAFMYSWNEVLEIREEAYEAEEKAKKKNKNNDK